MLISRAIGTLVLGVAALAAPPAHAAPFETQQSDGWILNAWTSEQTGAFRSCSMRTLGNDQVYLNLAENVHGRWFLTLYKSKWDLQVNDRFIATLNLDQNRKQPIAIDARVSNEHFLSLMLPAGEHVLEQLSRATQVRVSREARSYTFTLTGYDKAAQWVKACVARNSSLEASKPDGTIRGEDDDTSGEQSGDPHEKNALPAETPNKPPKLAPGVIETNATGPSQSDVVAATKQAISTALTAVTPTTTTATSTTTATATTTQDKPAQKQEVANIPATTSTPPISDAAKASPITTLGQSVSTANPPQGLLPNLMAAANRSDFKLLDASAAPEALKRAEVVFSLAGLTGVVMEFDLPTADAATNEVLAYDRIACVGDYSATTAPVEGGQVDVLRSTSECKTGDKSLLAHYLTLSKKSGGFYVVALTDEDSGAATVSGGKLADADRALFDAAIKVSGKF